MLNFKRYLTLTESVGMGGVKYERKVTAVLDRLEKEFPNFKRMATAGGDFSAAGSGDATFSINGDVINAEIKMDSKAQMGGTSIGYERDDDETSGVFPYRKIDKFDFGKIREEDIELFSDALTPIIEHLDNLIDYFKNLGDPFYDDVDGFPIKVKVKDWEQARERGWIRPTNKKISYDAQWIRHHYQKKNVSYIQIGGLGLFHTGRDILSLGVPMLDGNINIEMRPGAAGSGGKSYKNVGFRVQGRLKFKGTKSPISLDDYESTIAGFSRLLKKR